MAAATWALLAFVTGGVSLHLGFLHLSSRNPRNPAIIAALALIAAWALGVQGRQSQLIALDLRWTAGAVADGGWRAWRGWRSAMAWLDTRLPAAVAPAMALAIAGAVIVTSVKQTAFVAAGSDAWGYVSQAHMWATWTLRVPQPLMAELSGFLPREALAPLAYRPSPAGATIVPVTSPGLPMLMALFDLVAGASAVFAVVPLMAALAVWATYLLGRELSDRWTGVLAAALLATSPAFLFQLTSSPMSDIPAAAWWSLSLALALRGGRSRALGSGIAAGVAVLIRADLAPVAIVPAAIILFQGPGKAGRDKEGPAEWGRDTDGVPGAYPAMNRVLGTTMAGRRDVVWFTAGVVPAALFIAILYTYWYGSPLNSGYGTLEQLYSVANVVPNLSRYARWLPESQTPVILAGVAAPFFVTNRLAAAGLLMFVVAVVTCYVFYIPFDAWWYLRFLLPAFPAMLALTSSSLRAIAGRLPHQVRAVAILVAMVAIARYTIDYAAARATFDSAGEQKCTITGRYVAEHLPKNAVIFSEQHSGGIRYYSDRTTIRFGSIPADHLEGAVSELQRLGYRPYLVAEDWEEEVFRRQFAGRSILSSLASGPEVELPLGRVRIYRLAR